MIVGVNIVTARIMFGVILPHINISLQWTSKVQQSYTKYCCTAIFGKSVTGVYMFHKSL